MPFIICLISFIISSATIPSIILLANNNGAIALPGKRHIHTHPTPKFGGVAIALTVLLVSPFIFSIDRVIGSYLSSSALMLLLGIIDDVRGTNWKVKLVFSIVATSIIIFGAGIWVENLGNLFGFGEIHLGLWGIPVTLFAVFGVINAVNLIDGLNGLACGISSIAFLSFAVFASISGNSSVLYLSLANLGATLGFFRYNYPRARIFMGDSGSLFLGFSLAVMAILLTQGQGKINPMVPVVVLGIPIFDTLRVLIIRVKNKRHPFRADKTHLHHLMIRSGIPQGRVVRIIWILSSLMSFFAFVLFNFDSWLMLLVLCIVVASIGNFIENLRIIKLSATRKQLP
ncbi:MAG TPA: undecaprenyl/decaprenyl-phosphate alpha-N-acetylglucosaminyl 1-phosphate transferase [Nitrospirae bacterium]|nr:putative undecaprenyl-phosphate N-acetylglucosaminyl 1-phosphate transferase [bacterium BMS3Abin06]HDH12917.1 undecaprenyl/decaprenyl-phosphate alpha-N-acetylglucosaminyl 1-phosphate transferase [Nitrospirota bacterium]HDZ01671.1 undecaprenyl/decaprenyl-phosphate alpha-N-acetylglucosaminyl 1-phosphate transferase [Nitrospirota bacterium]